MKRPSIVLSLSIIQISILISTNCNNNLINGSPLVNNTYDTLIYPEPPTTSEINLNDSDIYHITSSQPLETESPTNMIIEMNTSETTDPEPTGASNYTTSLANDIQYSITLTSFVTQETTKTTENDELFQFLPTDIAFVDPDLPPLIIPDELPNDSSSAPSKEKLNEKIVTADIHKDETIKKNSDTVEQNQVEIKNEEHGHADSKSIAASAENEKTFETIGSQDSNATFATDHHKSNQTGTSNTNGTSSVIDNTTQEEGGEDKENDAKEKGSSSSNGVSTNGIISSAPSIAGIVIGALLFLIMIFIFGYFCIFRKNQHENQELRKFRNSLLKSKKSRGKNRESDQQYLIANNQMQVRHTSLSSNNHMYSIHTALNFTSTTPVTEFMQLDSPVSSSCDDDRLSKIFDSIFESTFQDDHHHELKGESAHEGILSDEIEVNDGDSILPLYNSTGLVHSLPRTLQYNSDASLEPSPIQIITPDGNWIEACEREEYKSGKFATIHNTTLKMLPPVKTNHTMSKEPQIQHALLMVQPQQVTYSYTSNQSDFISSTHYSTPSHHVSIDTNKYPLPPQDAVVKKDQVLTKKQVPLSSFSSFTNSTASNSSYNCHLKANDKHKNLNDSESGTESVMDYFVPLTASICFEKKYYTMNKTDENPFLEAQDRFSFDHSFESDKQSKLMDTHDPLAEQETYRGNTLHLNSPQANHVENPKTASAHVHTEIVAKRSYVPRLEDELSVVIGDSLFVEQTFKDG